MTDTITPPPGVALPVAAVIPYAGSSAPSGWLLCDGSAVSRTTYAALFAIISTTYGTGDGSTTFNLPDLRGRSPIGKNAGTFTTLGATGGEETHILVTAEAPSHTHTLTDPGHGHQERSGGGSGSSQTHASVGTTFSSSALYGNNPETEVKTTGITMASVGSDGSHNNLQPYQVLNFIVKY